jgi:EAL domain-containing protein (putative c-di-GMP-specific phosphodiesterase class I)/PleD family two-component response regulator
MKSDVWAVTQTCDLDDSLSAAPPPSPLLAAKVMMVDDEPLMTDLIQTHLEVEGYSNFVVTNDPREALELLRIEQPGVLLLDLMMPQMSGFELLEAIRDDRVLRYTPVIVLTAATGADSKLRALQLGATDFLSKPVDSSELVLRVRNTLAFHQYHNRLINYDPVTGLPNQRPFERGIDETLSRRQLVGGMVALFSISVPECRQLRESIDQNSADGLARTIGSRLDRIANAESSDASYATSNERAPRVARLGSEQFGLLLEGLPNAEAVEAIAKRMLAAISEPVMLGMHEVGPTAWIGISVSPADGDTTQSLRKSADLAATHAQAEGAEQFKFASRELNAKSYEKMTLGSQLRGAAQRGELRLHYQPKLDVASNRIVGMEALVRWQHPDRGLVPPVQFISLAEELGLIGTIGQWVIERACHDTARWARAGLGELTIAVNVAKPQFVGADLAATLRQAMFDSGLPARQLVVELTESMLMDDVRAGVAQMHKLKDLGITLSIDDFGTGYSSLSYLKTFPLDELKIDRSFIMDLPGRPGDVAIVRSIIDLGHSLGMSVTGEGIETVEQLECLKQLKCDRYQGFLFSKPLAAEPFEAMLSRAAFEVI